MIHILTQRVSLHQTRGGSLSDQRDGSADDHADLKYRVLSLRAIWWAAGVILVVGMGVAVWLLLAYGEGGDQARNQLEAIKTAGTIVVGAGGAAALLLAARRQRTAEITLKQKDREQAHQEADAAARRVTELYAKAADQLGSDKAPVRLAGLYALERLAQDNPAQRQTIVNVLCAYLRMPYRPPGDPPADSSPDIQADHRERIQERQVRLTAQRLLVDHLRTGFDQQPKVTYWADIDLNLAGATLIDFDLVHCILRIADFAYAKFTGPAIFAQTQFAGPVEFPGAEFANAANFEGTHFASPANFHGAQFVGPAWFDGARFVGPAWFEKAQFSGPIGFDGSSFAQEMPPEVSAALPSGKGTGEPDPADDYH